jgi:hypothetical protein
MYRELASGIGHQASGALAGVLEVDIMYWNQVICATRKVTLPRPKAQCPSPKAQNASLKLP